MNRKCFFGICTNNTQDECIERNLFGDQFPRYDTVAEGDIGFLWNVSNDKITGVFRALGPAREQIEPMAWGGQFPVQIRVKPVGGLHTLSQATPNLINTIRLITPRGRNYQIPQLRVHGSDVTQRILNQYFPNALNQLRTMEPPQNITPGIPAADLRNLIDLTLTEDRRLFEDVKDLYRDYETNDNIFSLIEALDLLTDEEVVSNLRLHNLKSTICRDITSKLRNIMQRYNIDVENMSNTEVVNISEFLSEMDFTIFEQLSQIKKDYCGI